MSGASVVALAMVLVACLAHAGAWKEGRATFYGADEWSIHTGTCGYTYLDKSVGTGWDVAALSDAVYDYGGACGRCYAIRCKNLSFKDGHGREVNRREACYDEVRTVKVQITDDCPCAYKGNPQANQQWCCGDSYHFDLSVWAFEKLANTSLGAIAIEYQVIDCMAPVDVPAPRVASPTRSPYDAPPQGWDPSKDRRPAASSMYSGPGDVILMDDITMVGVAHTEEHSSSPAASAPSPSPSLTQKPSAMAHSPYSSVDNANYPICKLMPAHIIYDAFGRAWGKEEGQACLAIPGISHDVFPGGGNNPAEPSSGGQSAATASTDGSGTAVPKGAVFTGSGTAGGVLSPSDPQGSTSNGSTGSSQASGPSTSSGSHLMITPLTDVSRNSASSSAQPPAGPKPLPVPTAAVNTGGQGSNLMITPLSDVVMGNSSGSPSNGPEPGPRPTPTSTPTPTDSSTPGPKPQADPLRNVDPTG